MGFYKNLVVLNDAEGRGTCGMLKLVLNGDLLQLQVAALLPDLTKGEYHLAVTDVDGCIQDFALGSRGKIAKTIEMKNRFNAAKRISCGLAEVGAGTCRLAALGGTNGEARFPYLFAEYFKTRPYYRPAVHKIPDGIEIVDILRDTPPEPRPEENGAERRPTLPVAPVEPVAEPAPEPAPAKPAPAEPSAPPEGPSAASAAEPVPAAPAAPTCEAAAEEKDAPPAEEAPPAPEEEDAILREDTTISDLLREENAVVACENYYDADYEAKLRMREAAKYYQPFYSTMQDYESYRIAARARVMSVPQAVPEQPQDGAVRAFPGGVVQPPAEEPERPVPPAPVSAPPVPEGERPAAGAPHDKIDAIEKLLDNATRGEEQPAPAKRFYDTVEDQLNKLFNDYGPEEYLERLIGDSRWAKVNYGGGDNFYTVGVIYDGTRPAYICYGIPGEYSEVPPKELDGFCEWLPRDMEKPRSKGYWMMYQDAATGESVNVGMR